MLKYGVVEPEGAQGYGTARIGLRAPRVAVRVESRSDWRSLFALAMWVASGLWGGYGFIYLPRGEGPLHPALARILTAYDPDYLVDALWTFGDVEALDPGWHARRVPDWPSDPEESAAALARSADMKVNTSGDDIGADRCSPFYDLPDDRSTRVLWEQDDGHAVHQLATLLGSGARRAEFEVPDGLDPLLMLALGMRAGYASKPTLSLGREAEGASDRLPQEYIGYALSVEGRPSIRHLGSLTTAWSLTRTGLVQIGKIRPLARPVAVIGSTADDFALAVALDRMFGMTAWIPVEWTQDPALRWQVNLGLHGLVNGSRYTGTPLSSRASPCRPTRSTRRLSQPGLAWSPRPVGPGAHSTPLGTGRLKLWPRRLWISSRPRTLPARETSTCRSVPLRAPTGAAAWSSSFPFRSSLRAATTCEARAALSGKSMSRPFPSGCLPAGIFAAM